MKDIYVILLAAGDSTRLWPLKDKHLIKFLDKPLIYHSVLQLKKSGFKHIVIVGNKNNITNFEQLRNQFIDLDMYFVIQDEKNGMAGAVVAAKNLIAGKKILIVGPSDIFEDFLIKKFQTFMNDHPDGIISGITVADYLPVGYLKIDGNHISGITEKPAPDKLPSNIVTFVFDYFKDASILLQAINDIGIKKEDCFEKSIDLMIRNGIIFKFLHYNGYWGYLKYPWHLLNIMSYYLGKIQAKSHPNIEIPGSSLISGNVYLDEGVRVLENAKIIGPCYIGKRTIIGNNTLVRESMISGGCVIGNGTEIARSYIGNNCWFHSNYIGDSIISDNVSIGSGTVLANFRLDESTIKSSVCGVSTDTGKLKLGTIIGENVRIGINASVMPGVKIGRECMISAGVILDRDLPDGKFYKISEVKYNIEDNRHVIARNQRDLQKKSLKLS